MTPPFECPAPAELRAIREWLGLSQSEFAEELGFRENGADVVRGWEIGERFGKPFSPTPLAWRAIRYMVLAVSLSRLEIGPATLRDALPERLR